MDILRSLINGEETVWLNPDRRHIVPREKINGYGFARMKAAQMRFMRFLPWFELAFPETAAKKGLIESGLFEITNMKDRLNAEGAGVTGRVLLKDDAHLPVAGSVKARGGIHEVLAIAEKTAQQADLLWPTENYAKVYSDAFREFYSRYTIQVGSTGNLGISIGRTAARLGFQVIVHMSSDAKEWKKELLRSEGVTVIEYEGDYGEAVASGRRESLKDENSFFIDDESRAVEGSL